LLKVNPATAAATVVGSLNTGLYVHGLAYDSAHGVMYGVGNEVTSTVSTLLTVNLSTGATTVVGLTGAAGAGDLAYDAASDTLYMSQTHGGPNALMRINRTTAQATLIGAFGPGVQVGMGMTVDPVLGLIAADNQANSNVPQTLYKVDAATGAATLIGTI